jgi:hypothetical protein
MFTFFFCVPTALYGSMIQLIPVLSMGRRLKYQQANLLASAQHLKSPIGSCSRAPIATSSLDITQAPLRFLSAQTSMIGSFKHVKVTSER